MRISGGHAGGRILKVPKGMAVRPTIDRVKQAIFNSLGERVVGARVLELFGGSGALSLESLSRGAVFAVCVELSPKHADFIRRNATTPGFDPITLEVRTQDVTPAHLEVAVTEVLLSHQSALEAGALIVMDEGRSRVRILPLTLSKRN